MYYLQRTYERSIALAVTSPRKATVKKQNPFCTSYSCKKGLCQS